MHFDRGRAYSRAVPYRRQAAEHALQRHAYREALGHLTRGLEMLQTLPPTPEYLQHELALQTLLGTVLMVTEGYAPPGVEHAYLRARALCEHLGETSQLFPVLWGLLQVYATRGDLHTARELAEQLLDMAQRTPTPAFPWRGHIMPWG